jgi:hypothetical protein
LDKKMSEKDESERGTFREEREVGICRKKVSERMHLHREKECIYTQRERVHLKEIEKMNLGRVGDSVWRGCI